MVDEDEDKKTLKKRKAAKGHRKQQIIRHAIRIHERSRKQLQVSEPKLGGKPASTGDQDDEWRKRTSNLRSRVKRSRKRARSRFPS